MRNKFANALSALRHRRTIRFRLALLLGALFLICGIGLVAITYALVGNSQVTVQGPGGLAVTVAGGDASATQTVNNNSPTEASSGPTLTQDLTPAQRQEQTELLRQMATQQHAAQLHEFLTKSGIALAIMAAVSILLGWLVAGRLLHRLQTITMAAREASATNLHRRLGFVGPDDELKNLGDTFDQLLDRLEASFAAQRQFIANVSHELRTPLARQRMISEVALADGDADADSLRDAHERILTAGTQQNKLIDALMSLARGQAGIENHQPFDLRDIAEQVIDYRTAEAWSRNLEVIAHLAPAPGKGDPHLVERLLANLVDNAVRHNVPHGHVEVTTGTRDGGAVLTVSNSGPDVPPAAIELLFRPFQRLEPARTRSGEGFGLGLSIVQTIASTHHAEVDARPRPGGGLTITVAFPPNRAPAASAGRHQKSGNRPTTEPTLA